LVIRLSFIDAAPVYTMVKKNWFTGWKCPSIRNASLMASIELVREFGISKTLSTASPEGL